MSFLKLQGQGFSNLASLFSVMKDKSSVFFYLKPHILWTRIPHQSEIFGLLSGWVKIHPIPHVISCQTFDYSCEISPNLYFDRLLLLKVYKVSAKKAWRSYVSWYQRVVKIWRETYFLFQKMTRIWWILIRALKRLKNLHSDWSLCAKYTAFDLKKYRGIYFMTLMSHVKFEEKLTCGLENNMSNLANFHQNTWKCQNLYFHAILLSKVENAWVTNLLRRYK